MVGLMPLAVEAREGQWLKSDVKVISDGSDLMNKVCVNAAGDCYPAMELVSEVELLESSKCMVVSCLDVEFELKEDSLVDIVISNSGFAVDVEFIKRDLGIMYLTDSVSTANDGFKQCPKIN